MRNLAKFRNPEAFAAGFNAGRLVKLMTGRHALPRAQDAYDMGYAMGLLCRYVNVEHAYAQFLCDPSTFIDNSAYQVTPAKETV